MSYKLTSVTIRICNYYEALSFDGTIMIKWTVHV